MQSPIQINVAEHGIKIAKSDTVKVLYSHDSRQVSVVVDGIVLLKCARIANLEIVDADSDQEVKGGRILGEVDHLCITRYANREPALVVYADNRRVLMCNKACAVSMTTDNSLPQ
jgi:hypothetical protein